MSEVFDLCVVGAGLFGSSVARHASLRTGTKVILIGPEEPEVKEGHSIFGAYFDESRLTCATSNDPLWAMLSKDSSDRYYELEELSGILFYSEVGHLTVGKGQSTMVKDIMATVSRLSTNVIHLQAEDLRNTFTFLRVRDGDIGLLETSSSGWINPRKLRQAEQNLAMSNGCKILNDVVNDVTNIGQASVPLFQLTTELGQVVLSQRVLLCTGAYTAFRALLPPGLEPDVKLLTQTVVFAEVTEQDALGLLANMPSIDYLLDDDVDMVSDRVACYILPPIKHPDGKYYLKLGHDKQFERPLQSEKEVSDWFIKPVPEEIKNALIEILHGTFPTLEPVSYKTGSCVTTNTLTFRPYMDMVRPGLGVVLGGCGLGAMACDQLGLMGANMVLGDQWQYEEFPQELLKCQWKSRHTDV